MPIVATEGDTVDVYQFQKFSVSEDQMRTSRRYGTKQAIQTIANGQVLYDTKISVDRSVVESPNTDIPGMTSIGFKPAVAGGFPRRVQ